MRLLSAVGRAAWCVFVIGAIFAQLGMSRMVSTPGLADDGFGWTAYTPLSTATLVEVDDGLTYADYVGITAWVALAVAVIALLAATVATGHVMAGSVALASTAAGAALVLFDWSGRLLNVVFHPHIAFVLVLAGIAIAHLGTVGLRRATQTYPAAPSDVDAPVSTPGAAR